MKLTKYSHACVHISDDQDRRLVIDPGIYSEAAEALGNMDAVLITHEHPDHLDTQTLARAAESNRNLRIWGPKSVTDALANIAALDGRLTTVGPGETFTAGGLSVRTFGGQHALIHSSVPVISNVSYLVGDAIYHPGDCYTVPNAAVEVLLIPISAPWAKISDTYDFTISVRAPRAFQIHDALINEIGHGLYESHMSRIGELYGVTRFQHLDPRETVEL